MLLLNIPGLAEVSSNYLEAFLLHTLHDNQITEKIVHIRRATDIMRHRYRKANFKKNFEKLKLLVLIPQES